MAKNIEPKIEVNEDGAITKVTLTNPGPNPGWAPPREAKIPQPPEPAPPVPFAKTANNGEEPRREALARGLMQFDVLKAERDQLDKDLTAARERIHLLEIHITELEGTRGTIESRINTCVLERDQAVREAGELRGALNAVAAVCAKYHSVLAAPAPIAPQPLAGYASNLPCDQGYN